MLNQGKKEKKNPIKCWLRGQWVSLSRWVIVLEIHDFNMDHYFSVIEQTYCLDMRRFLVWFHRRSRLSKSWWRDEVKTIVRCTAVVLKDAAVSGHWSVVSGQWLLVCDLNFSHRLINDCCSSHKLDSGRDAVWTLASCCVDVFLSCVWELLRTRGIKNGS